MARLPLNTLAAFRAVAEVQNLRAAAETLLELVCPSCAHAWQRSFDVTAFLWTEISAYAKRLLREIDALAAAYGWQEQTILRMTAARRRGYLELVAERGT